MFLSACSLSGLGNKTEKPNPNVKSNPNTIANLKLKTGG